MAVERRDPVPPGRYYVFVDEDKAPEWRAWTSQHSGLVRVIVTEPQTVSPNVPIWATTPTGEVIKAYAGDWILFDVFSPVPWVNIGLPTIVTDMRVRSTRDVYSLPEPSGSTGPLEQMQAALQVLVTLAAVGGAVVLGSAVMEGVRATQQLGRSS